MGKRGKKARKFAKKNLQSAEKRNRKQKPFLKKKNERVNGNGRREAEDEEKKMIEQPHKKREKCLEENPKDIVIDAVFDNGESDSDGYLDEQSKNKAIDHPMQVVDETRTDTMKRKVLCGTVLTSCCALVDEEQSAQSINHETFAKVMIFVLQKADHTFRSILGLSGSSNKRKDFEAEEQPKMG
ncbi:unnamed protein product [Brassica oleracea]